MYHRRGSLPGGTKHPGSLRCESSIFSRSSRTSLGIVRNPARFSFPMFEGRSGQKHGELPKEQNILPFSGGRLAANICGLPASDSGRKTITDPSVGDSSGVDRDCNVALRKDDSEQHEVADFESDKISISGTTETTNSKSFAGDVSTPPEEGDNRSSEMYETALSGFGSSVLSATDHSESKEDGTQHADEDAVGETAISSATTGTKSNLIEISDSSQTAAGNLCSADGISESSSVNCAERGKLRRIIKNTGRFGETEVKSKKPHKSVFQTPNGCPPLVYSLFRETYPDLDLKIVWKNETPISAVEHVIDWSITRPNPCVMVPEGHTRWSPMDRRIPVDREPKMDCSIVTGSLDRQQLIINLGPKPIHEMEKLLNELTEPASKEPGKGPMAELPPNIINDFVASKLAECQQAEENSTYPNEFDLRHAGIPETSDQPPPSITTPEEVEVGKDSSTATVQSKSQVQTPFHCSKCKLRKFSSKYLLRNHEEFDCHIDPLYRCPICHLTFTRVTYVERHVTANHPALAQDITDLSRSFQIFASN